MLNFRVSCASSLLFACFAIGCGGNPQSNDSSTVSNGRAQDTVSAETGASYPTGIDPTVADQFRGLLAHLADSTQTSPLSCSYHIQPRGLSPVDLTASFQFTVGSAGWLGSVIDGVDLQRDFSYQGEADGTNLPPQLNNPDGTPAHPKFLTAVAYPDEMSPTLKYLNGVYSYTSHIDGPLTGMEENDSTVLRTNGSGQIVGFEFSVSSEYQSQTMYEDVKCTIH